MKGFIRKFTLAAAVLLAVLFIIASNLLPSMTEKLEDPESISLIGEYSIDGGPWQPLAESTDFDNRRIHTIVLRGRLSREIKEGESLLLYVRNLYVTLKADGKVVYQFGNENEKYFFNTPGIALSQVKTGRVPQGARVEFVITNAFCNTISGVTAMLDALAVGDRAQLYEKLIRVDGLLIFGSICSAVLGLITMLLSLISRILRSPYASKSAALGFFAFATGLWFLYSVNYSFLPLLITKPQLAAANDILSLYIMSLAGTALVNTFVDREYQKYSAIPTICVYGGQAVLYLFQLFGIVQLYEVQAACLVFTLLASANYGILAAGAARLRRSESILAAVCIVPAVVGGLAECVNYFIFSLSRTYVISTIGFTTTYILLLLLVAYQIKRSNDALIHAHKLEKDLAENRIAMMLTQIQPHFLYNSLTGIKQLCDMDPKKASEALGHFAYFLRGNLNSLTDRTMIPFTREMVHVQDYLYLEKLRFGDRLSTIMEITVTDFMMPPLILQTIVENSVKHGIMKKKEGGTITIKNWQDEESIIITITDNGVGFDQTKTKEDGRTHVGIANVRSRLEMQCNGRLYIKSKVGAGTEVRIVLPERRNCS